MRRTSPASEKYVWRRSLKSETTMPSGTARIPVAHRNSPGPSPFPPQLGQKFSPVVEHPYFVGLAVQDQNAVSDHNDPVDPGKRRTPLTLPNCHRSRGPGTGSTACVQLSWAISPQGSKKTTTAANPTSFLINGSSL